jgi:hypothetical protein
MHDALTGTTWSRDKLMQLITGLTGSSHSYKPCDVLYTCTRACVCVSLSDLVVRSFRHWHYNAAVISYYVRAGQMSVSISDNGR